MRCNTAAASKKSVSDAPEDDSSARFVDRGDGFDDPAAGYLAPREGIGAGLWVARQLTWRIEFFRSPAGFTTTHLALGEPVIIHCRSNRQLSCPQRHDARPPAIKQHGAA